MPWSTGGAVSRGERGQAMELSSAFMLNCFFYLPSVCGTMRHQMPQLVARHCLPAISLASPPLAMLLLIAIMPAVSSQQGSKGTRAGGATLE